MLAALYCRVSTPEQAKKFSPESQLRELRALAAERGYTVPPGGEYADAFTGRELDRPALDRLREALRAGAYQVVLVHDPDRLARRFLYQLLLLDEFERQGIQFEFKTTPYDASPEGQLLLNVKGVYAEFERRKILERTLRGKREKARRGLVVASYPYGYRPDPAAPGRLVVHEPEAGIVRMIYTWLIDERRSTRSIVDELRRLGIPSARPGRRWGPTQVRRILKSEAYTGRVYFNRDQVVNGRRKQRPGSEWIPVEIPAIIAPERYAAAQAQLAHNRQHLVGRPARFAYLLRGLLRCGDCGTRYEGVPSHGRRYYRCHGRDRFTAGPRCRAPWLSATAAEKVVWEAVSDALRRPAALRQAVERYETSRGVRDVELRSRAEQLRGQIHEIERKERRLLDLVLEDEQLVTGEVRGRLQAFAHERTRLTEELERAEARVLAQGDPQHRRAAIERWCRQARRGLDRLDEPGRRKLLLELVDEARVGPDRTLEIYGILPPGAVDTKMLLLR